MATTGKVPQADQELPEEELHAPYDFDSWYSGMASFLFHLAIMVLIPLLATMAVVEDLRPPEVGTIEVADSTDMDAGDPGEQGEEALEFTESASSLDTSSPIDPLSTAIDIPTQDIPVPEVESASDIARDILETASEARARAKSAAQRARDALNNNLGGTPGGNGSGGTGRAGRASRWVLTFSTNSPDTYLNQLGGLGAEIALPDGDSYQYFTDLAGGRNRVRRSLQTESRIYWIDDTTYRSVAALLGFPTASHMLAFLPGPLEEKMASLEMVEARRNGVSREEDIKQTVFHCVARGGSFDVIVDRQSYYR